MERVCEIRNSGAAKTILAEWRGAEAPPAAEEEVRCREARAKLELQIFAAVCTQLNKRST
jgi:hypothetical protein